MKEIRPRTNIRAAVTLPGSKSLSHRALIAAGLAHGRSEVSNLLACEDADLTRQALETMGVVVFEDSGMLEVLGVGGRAGPPAGRTIFLGNSGTSMRLLLGVAAASGNEYVFDGAPRMRERPVGELLYALNNLGAEILSLKKEGFPPLLVRGRRLRGGKVCLSGGESSQYLSSLLLAGPCTPEGVEVNVGGDLVSRAYVDMTLDVMEAFGVEVSREGYRHFRVKGGQGYRACRYAVEADVSSASYFWAAAAVTGGTVVTENIDPFLTRQGDIGFLDILQEMGCLVEKKPGRVTVRGGTLSGVEVDMGGMPDLVPTLAAVAQFAEGETVIRNVSHLRHKESDRLQCVKLEWERLGGKVEERPDGLIVRGGSPLSGGIVNPHNDHRLAMSLAVTGLRVPGVKIADEACVRKSFPRFWEMWENL